MIANPKHNDLSPEEYLEWEAKQPLKYEYIDGEVVAMVGGSIAHGTITGNLFYQLKTYLRGGSCRPFIFDVKVGVSEFGPFYYPDGMVSCDQRDQNATHVIYHPCLIIEVLSPSTERLDRGKKFQNYRKIDTLQEYVLVSTDQKLVECFRLNHQGVWEIHSYTDGNEVELTTLGFRCSLAEIYEDVILEEIAAENTAQDS